MIMKRVVGSDAEVVLQLFEELWRLPVGAGNLSALPIGRVVPPGSAIRLVVGLYNVEHT
jgi:hypothetical protein